MKKFFNEFREFAVKGNVIDLAVGVIIGASFQKIITSIVDDIIMPLLSIILGKNIFSSLNLKIIPYNSTEAVSINFGNFLQISFNFILMAFSIFLLVKGLNALRRISEKGIKVIIKNDNDDESGE